MEDSDTKTRVGNEPTRQTTKTEVCQVSTGAVFSTAPTHQSKAAKSAFEERLVRDALYVVMAFSMAMWCCLLPLWWYDILTLIPRVAWHQVQTVYHHGQPDLTDRLERVLLFWPRGFIALLSIKDGNGRRPDLIVETKAQLLVKTLFAIAFYTVMYFTSVVATWCAEAGFSLVGLLWHLLFSLFRLALA